MTTGLKTYPPTWNGELLLACRKCQKKLKGEHGMRALAKLKKTIRRDGVFHLVNVPCMDMCPKKAVTVYLDGKLSILRSEADLSALQASAKPDPHSRSAGIPDRKRAQ